MDNPPNNPKLAPSLRQPSKVTGPPFSTKPTMRSVLGSSSTCGVTVAPMLLRIESGLPNTLASSTVISLDSDTRRTPGRRVSESSGNQKNPAVTIGSRSTAQSYWEPQRRGHRRVRMWQSVPPTNQPLLSQPLIRPVSIIFQDFHIVRYDMSIVSDVILCQCLSPRFVEIP